MSRCDARARGYAPGSLGRESRRPWVHAAVSRRDERARAGCADTARAPWHAVTVFSFLGGSSPVNLGLSHGLSIECLRVCTTENKKSTVPVQMQACDGAEAAGNGPSSALGLSDDAVGRELWHAAQEGRVPAGLGTKALHQKALHVALWNDHDASAVALLVAAGTKHVNAPITRDGRTPLGLAAFYGSVHCIKALLENGAAADLPDKIYNTPLAHAASAGHVQAVALLVSAGADVARVCRFGALPIHFAAIQGHASIVQLLLDVNVGVDVRTTRNLHTSMHYAAMHGHAPLVQLLLERNADITCTNDDGDSPLHCATQEGHGRVVRLLLEERADVTWTNLNGATPLHRAATHGHADIAQALLCAKAGVDAVEGHGDTALAIAAFDGHATTVSVLLDAKAAVDRPDVYGFAPLASAASQGHLSTVSLLVAAKASVNRVGAAGRTAVSLAQEQGHLRVVNMLSSVGARLTHVARRSTRKYDKKSAWQHTYVKRRT